MLTKKEFETIKELISKFEKNIKTDDTYSLNVWDLETGGVSIFSQK